jgi:hypothetical protein
MANVFSIEKQVAIISALAEGSAVKAAIVQEFRASESAAEEE